MQQEKNSFQRQQAEPGNRNNVRSFPAPEPVSSNPFDQVNKFDLAQWDRIVKDISKPDVAKAVVLVMNQRDSLQGLFPSIYVRAHQTCIKAERKAQAHAKRIATAKKILAISYVTARVLMVRIHYRITHLVKPVQQRLFK